jgi:ankyrin repeat protein
MPRQLTTASTLDNLKREAKRWLKALRANIDEARARLERALPDVPAVPTLRDVQHALAREHGLPGWTALRQWLTASAPIERTHAERVEWFFENACPDHHVRGGPDHLMARSTAMHILERYPEIARDSIYTAVVCGDLEEVERILAERPAAASERSSATAPDRADVGGSGDRFKRRIGPKGWDPLLYLCFTRIPLAAASDNALAIARTLLDHGADPNAFFMAGDSRYTPLVGVIGGGEESRPPHPQRDALVQLLLDRGAEPYDIQVVYNLGFSGEVLWFLKAIHARAVAIGRQADWDDPSWAMLDMGGYGSGARWHYDIAVKHNDLELARWMLAHGASPDARPPRDRRFSRRSLREEAIRGGLSEMAELLTPRGESGPLVVDGEAAFVAACMRLDRANAGELAARHPEYLRSPLVMMLAAKQDRADVVGLLLDLGMSPDIEDAPEEGRQRPLHVAAYSESTRVTALLIERGAMIDPFDTHHGGTPLWFATWGQRQRTIDLLSPVSRDLWSLSLNGKVERVREVLRAEPALARIDGGGDTPLMYLPGDEARAIELVELFLSLGADPTIRIEDGMTAADLARKRDLDEAAALLRHAEMTHEKPLNHTST